MNGIERFIDDVKQEFVDFPREDATSVNPDNKLGRFEKNRPDKPAKSFSTLLSLVNQAEKKLIGCGFKDVEQRILAIRGLYYGTEWSNDYQAEKRSQMRNYGFFVYTGFRSPPDPRRCLNFSLMDALRNSQDVRSGDREIDFGHLIIGLDARFEQLAIERKIEGHGATGLEIVTWVGDLGAGAGALAKKRVNNPKSNVSWVFLNKLSDYGASANLEGDVAAYLVARDHSITDQPSRPQFEADADLTDALMNYLGKNLPSPDWTHRSRLFLSMIGGKFTNSGDLQNREILISTLAQKFASFGLIYIILREVDNKRFDKNVLYNVLRYLDGSAHEVAEVFLNILSSTFKDSEKKLKAQPPFPDPTPPSNPVNDIEQFLEETIRQIPDPIGLLKGLIG